MKTYFSTALDTSIKKRLEEYCAKSGRSITEVVNAALKEYLSRQFKKEA